MIKFDTKQAKILLCVYCIAVIIGLALFVDIWQSWSEHNQARSLRLAVIEGILLEAIGFVTLLEPIITKIFTKRESNLKADGIFCVIAGLFIQGISIYLSS